MHLLRDTVAVVVACGLFALPAPAGLRVVTWNVTNYSSGRVEPFQSSIYAAYSGRCLEPDILIGQEFISEAGVSNFLAILNTASNSPGDWEAAPFINGPDTDSAFFYRPCVAEFLGVTVVSEGGVAPNHPRNVQRYDIRLADGSILACYSTHMKAGSTGADQARRLVEAQAIRDDAELLPEPWHFLLAGDLNIQTSSQSAYQELVSSQANDDGRFHDPICTPGSWNNSGFYRYVHTQDPVGAGGMDDRHDQILLSDSLVDDTGLEYVGNPSLPYSTTAWDDPNHSYRSWGNDGTSFNTSLTVQGNTMVGEQIAQALVHSTSAGHLPVVLELAIPGDIDGDADIDLDDAVGFFGCLAGPGASPDPAPPLSTEQCLRVFDGDGDGDVDMKDFRVLQLVILSLAP